jgi:trimeric autotransporter adhesin
MSTKTTFKRIALVAVAALGLGVLTSVAPANAAASDVTAISVGTSTPARVGVWGGTTTVTLASGSLTSAVTLTAQITASPSTSANAGLDFVAKAVSTANAVITSETATSTTAAVANVVFDLKAGAKESIDLKIKTDVAGTYQVLVNC